MPAATVNELGQVESPEAIRQPLGIAQGSRLAFDHVDDHLELRVEPPVAEAPAAGFGMLEGPRRAVPADWDAATAVRLFNETNVHRKENPTMGIAVEDLNQIDFSDVADGDLEPVPPAEVLACEFLEPLGINSERLAQAIGMPHPLIGDILAGRQAITAETGLRLSRVFGTSDGFWVGLQADYDAAKARQSPGAVLGRIQPLSNQPRP